MKKGEPYKEPEIYKPATHLEYQFFGTEIDNPIVCAKFGCSKRLSLQEVLFGNTCISCQQIVKFDITKAINL